MMPFLAPEHLPIPDQDILSWSLDEPHYDLDRPLFIDAAKPSRTISARQARGLIERLITGFKAAGVKEGDCVCMHAFNDICYSMAFLGAIGAGGVFAGTNPSYTSYELAHAIRTADVEYMLVEPSLLPSAISAAKITSLPLSRIVVFNPPDSDAATQSSPLQSQLALHDWQCGTTGLPKALNLTHHNLIAQHPLVMEHPLHAPRRRAAYTVRRLLCTPMFRVSHAYVTLNQGAKLSEKEVFDYVAERLAKYKRLDGGVTVVDSIPKNAGGKTLKNQLRELAKRELGVHL